MADRLPMTLHAYRLLTAAALPLADLLLSYRLKRGKEHPLRMPERRGEPSTARPEGPLVWLHGASVGELTAVLPIAVWCMESSVMPGDSGGALLVEGAQGRLYYLGVISAQRGLIPEVTASASERRSLATALYPSLGFFSARARALGYLP